MNYSAPSVTTLGNLADLTLDRINKTGRNRDSTFPAPLAGTVTVLPS